MITNSVSRCIAEHLYYTLLSVCSSQTKRQLELAIQSRVCYLLLLSFFLCFFLTFFEIESTFIRSIGSFWLFFIRDCEGRLKYLLCIKGRASSHFAKANFTRVIYIYNRYIGRNDFKEASSHSHSYSYSHSHSRHPKRIKQKRAVHSTESPKAPRRGIFSSRKKSKFALLSCCSCCETILNYLSSLPRPRPPHQRIRIDIAVARAKISILPPFFSSPTRPSQPNTKTKTKTRMKTKSKRSLHEAFPSIHLVLSVLYIQGISESHRPF